MNDLGISNREEALFSATKSSSPRWPARARPERRSRRATKLRAGGCALIRLLGRFGTGKLRLAQERYDWQTRDRNHGSHPR